MPQSCERTCGAQRARQWSAHGTGADLGVCTRRGQQGSSTSRQLGAQRTLSMSNQIIVRPSAGAGPRGSPLVVVTCTAGNGRERGRREAGSGSVPDDLGMVERKGSRGKKRRGDGQPKRRNQLASGAITCRRLAADPHPARTHHEGESARDPMVRRPQAGRVPNADTSRSRRKQDSAAPKAS